MRVFRQTVAGVDPPLVAAISQPVEDRSLRNTRPRALLANGRSQKLLPTTETDGSPDSLLEGGVSCELVSEVKFASRAPMGRFHGDWERFLVP